MRDFEQQLTGGHPNSLGNTVEVVEAVLANPSRFAELFSTYFSTDEVVRLRVSSAMKRIAAVNKALLIPYIDRFLDDISEIDQPSTQWTLAQLFELLADDMSVQQKERALRIMQRNLSNARDWIVLNRTMITLGKWAEEDPNLRQWLIPHLERLSMDDRKSVARTASRFLHR